MARRRAQGQPDEAAPERGGGSGGREPSGGEASGPPLILGHRGASADAPENTLAAFHLAMEQGADGVELDVWRCASGEVVVAHDEDLSRVAGSPIRVPDAALEALRVLDVGGWKDPRFHGERVPLLSEVLEALPTAFVNVELKSRSGRDLALASAAASVIRRAGAGGRVVVSSFDWRLLAAFRLAAPEVATGLLFDGRTAWRLRTFLGIRGLRPAAVHPDRRLATDARIAAWTSRGLEVNVWTVDDPEEAARLARAGASALITNVPRAIRAALAAR